QATGGSLPYDRFEALLEGLSIIRRGALDTRKR
ncbi:MAG: hypothetical protein JWN72_784, partial [Thermoleophilia bacterium]|nr:hypothetical protein [Thermoleophilia bacterium]